MIRFRRIAIRNFACFENACVEPSVDAKKRLTIIRAENGSGKTTFLRAVRWALYGEKGLPGADTRKFSVHSADWVPNKRGLETSVEIEFETDKETRMQRGHARRIFLFNLRRCVTTIRNPVHRDNEPDYQRVGETAVLMEQEMDGGWVAIPHPEQVMDQLLPWELNDFFVLDADKAADFVGGSENKEVPHRDVIAKTTKVVQSLLGIDVFKDATLRVEDLQRTLGSEIAKAIGDKDLTALQDRLEDCRQREEQLREQAEGERHKKEELDDRLQRAKGNLEKEIKGIGGAGQLAERLSQTEHREKKLLERFANKMILLGGQLESTSLLAALMERLVKEAYHQLNPLHESGTIPRRHLQFVSELLEEGVCVCGQDISTNGKHRRHLEERVATTKDLDIRAEYLGNLYDSVRAFVRGDLATQWEKNTANLGDEVESLRCDLADLKREQRKIRSDLDKIDEEKIQLIRDEINALESQREKSSRELINFEVRLRSLNSETDSLEKTVRSRAKTERVVRDKRAAEDLAGAAARVLRCAYGAIESSQVEELSRRMNQLFAQMAANVPADETVVGDANKATLRMIAKVGLRSVEGANQGYEICAFNRRNRLMPPIEINGASRRVLALSFVLALCNESQTHAPFLADSLLNFMSGAVRRNTLLATIENSSQPILFLTGSDLEGRSEVEIAKRYAGATYTLTGQWDVRDGDGGDVVHRTLDGQVSVVCRCGPRHYCNVCERLGQRMLPDWSGQTDGGFK